MTEKEIKKGDIFWRPMSYGPWVEVVIDYVHPHPMFSERPYGIKRTDTGRHLGYVSRTGLWDTPPPGVRTERKERKVRKAM